MSLLLAAAPIVSPTAAQDRQSLERRLAQRRSDFRLRVQAAFALGNTGDARAVPALASALSDPNPAVRAASATALGRLGSSRAIPALRAARRDASAAVRMQAQRSIAAIEEAERGSAASMDARTAGRSRGARRPLIEILPEADRIAWPRVRYVVTLGDMNNRSDFESEELARSLRAEITRQLRVIRGIAVMQSEVYVDDRARREMRRRGLPSLRLDGSISSVQKRRQGRDLSVRCEISLMLLDGQRRSLRGELRGAATGTEPTRSGTRAQRAEQEQRLAQQALEGAVRSAMSNARQAFSRAINQ